MFSAFLTDPKTDVDACYIIMAMLISIEREWRSLGLEPEPAAPHAMGHAGGLLALRGAV